MDLTLVAKEITKKMGGDVDDFIAYLKILRTWLDQNYSALEHIELDFDYSLSCKRLLDLQAKSLYKSIMKYKEKDNNEPMPEVQ